MRRGEHAPPKPEVLVLSIRLESGSFETTLRCPLIDAASTERHIATWLELIHTAMIKGVERMQATLAETSAEREAQGRPEVPQE